MIAGIKNMREFKFRAWDNINKRYYKQPFFICSNGLEYIYNENNLIYEEFDAINPVMGLKIEQFTGLTDKNGKEIYEGDIVRCYRLRYPDTHAKNIDFTKLPWPKDHWYDCIEIGLIRYSDVSLCFVEDYEKIRYDDISPLSCGTDHRYEIIGNIQENPELLK